MDPTIERLCKQISEEQGIELAKVRNAVKHLFNWLRINFMGLNYAAILVNKLGTFSVMENRAKDNKEVVKEYNKKRTIDGKSTKES